MNELQNKYIRNQILSVPMKLNQELTHKDKKFNKRSDYDNIIKYIDNFLEGDNINRFLVLPGVRDVGKTTLLFQVYEYLLKERGISPENILYFSCDRLKKIGNADIFSVVNSYLETYHNSIIETLSISQNLIFSSNCLIVLLKVLLLHLLCCFASFNNRGLNVSEMLL